MFHSPLSLTHTHVVLLERGGSNSRLHLPPIITFGTPRGIVLARWTNLCPSFIVENIKDVCFWVVTYVSCKGVDRDSVVGTALIDPVAFVSTQSDSSLGFKGEGLGRSLGPVDSGSTSIIYACCGPPSMGTLVGASSSCRSSDRALGSHSGSTRLAFSVMISVA